MTMISTINDFSTKTWVKGYMKGSALIATTLGLLSPVAALANTKNVFQDVGTAQLGSDINSVAAGDLGNDFQETGKQWLNLVWVVGMVLGAFFVVSGLMKLSSSKNTNQPTTGAWVTIGVGVTLLAASPVAWIMAARLKKAVGKTK